MSWTVLFGLASLVPRALAMRGPQQLRPETVENKGSDGGLPEGEQLFGEMAENIRDVFGCRTGVGSERFT